MERPRMSRNIGKGRSSVLLIASHQNAFQFLIVFTYRLTVSPATQKKCGTFNSALTISIWLRLKSGTVQLPRIRITWSFNIDKRKLHSTPRI